MATEQFHYEHDGKTFTLPKLENIPAGLMRRVRKLPEVDGAFTIIEEVADETALEVIDSMTLVEFMRFQEAWEKGSGSSLGESSASSTS